MLLVLNESEQDCVRTLSAFVPVDGAAVPRSEVIRILAELIPSDAVGLGAGELPGADCSGANDALTTGVLHCATIPTYVEALRGVGLADRLAVGLGAGSSTTVQIHLDRRRELFTDRDVACLSLVSPALLRFLRGWSATRLSAALTAQERTVLSLVGAGYANLEIAERLFVAPCTVRKHLEHAYRKLGVTNRMAATARIRGDCPDVADADYAHPEFA